MVDIFLQTTKYRHDDTQHTRATRKENWDKNMNLGTYIYTFFNGKLIGKDTDGNRYYEKKQSSNRPNKRWVLYKKNVEATNVPPMYHAWLHHTSNEFPNNITHRPWQKTHQPNKTGTASAHLPAGHKLKGGKRARATGDYEPWQPKE